MTIRRIRVEEGFLDGVDVEFADGLNVIVGPRGAGKTSLIELIRFALDVRGYTDASEQTALGCIVIQSVFARSADGRAAGPAISRPHE